MRDRIADARNWVEQNDPKLFRSFPLAIEELRDSGNGVPGSYAIKGTASVYDRWSLDLGGFRERVLPGAFDRVLSEDPHVIHTWDHDTARALSSTRSKQYPLELKSQKDGLHFYSRVAPTTDASNLRILMEGGVIDQSSFAFTVRDSEWRYLEDEDMLERDIVEVDGLFDVTTCALGAYPQTESEIALRSVMHPQRTVGFADLRDWNGFPALTTATTAGSSANGIVVATQSFGTRSSGAEGNAEPAEEDAPGQEVPEAADVDAPEEEVVQPPADQPAREESVAEREAKEREHAKWRQTLLAQHRRTREFVFGVPPTEQEG